ncbi:MAG: hypothetical protein KDN18_15805 [Verrucomicrobiae bacterium]|nr:hypothetical protein [Verrucomicrobiae bacterium]
MRRYLLASLAIGGGASLLALSLHWTGVFSGGAVWLGEFYHSRGLSSGVEWVKVFWLEILVTLLASLGTAWAVIEVTRLPRKIGAGVGALLVVLLLSPTLSLHGILLNPAAPFLATIAAFAGALVYSRSSLGRRKWLLEEALGDRVSSKVFKRMLEAPSEPDFGGNVCEVTILVCCHFPGESSGPVASPGDVMKMGSLFQRAVSTFLLSRGAYLDESGPERVRATFGLTGESTDHAVDASRAALDLKLRLSGLAEEFESRWFHVPRFGVGIETAQVTAGLCGIPGRFFLATLGGGESFAGRLALANARFGSQVLAGPNVYQRVRGTFELRPMEMVYDSERQVLHETYELLAPTGSDDEVQKTRREEFWKGVILLRQKSYEGALEAFSKARIPGVDDAPLAYFTALAQDQVALPESRPRRLVRELTEDGHARSMNRF